MMARQKIMILGLTLLLTACGTEVSISGPAPSVSPETERLANWMTGEFTAADNSSVISTVRIWPDEEGTRWVYLEARNASTPAQPVRQQALQFGPGNDGDLAINLYTFPVDRTPPANVLNDPDWFNRIDPLFMVAQPGCTVHVLPDGSSRFTGQTTGDGCPDSIAGANHVTLSLTVSAEGLEVWERGWKKDGTQAWGPTTGPIEFVRRGR